MIIYVENSKESTKLLEPINEFNKIAEYDIIKKIVFLHTISQQFENKLLF